MSITLPEIDLFLQQSGFEYEVWPCDPELADTAAFCAHYDVALENSANAILVRSKTGAEQYALCVLLATHRLNTNHTVRKKLGARKVSFASAEQTRELTGMEIELKEKTRKLAALLNKATDVRIKTSIGTDINFSLLISFLRLIETICALERSLFST